MAQRYLDRAAVSRTARNIFLVLAYNSSEILFWMIYVGAELVTDQSDKLQDDNTLLSALLNEALPQAQNEAQTTQQEAIKEKQRSSWLQSAQVFVSVAVGTFAFLGAFTILASEVGIEFHRGFYEALNNVYIPKELFSGIYIISGWTYLLLPSIAIIGIIAVAWMLIKFFNLSLEWMWYKGRYKSITFVLIVILSFVLSIVLSEIKTDIQNTIAFSSRSFDVVRNWFVRYYVDWTGIIFAAISLISLGFAHSESKKRKLTLKEHRLTDHSEGLQLKRRFVLFGDTVRRLLVAFSVSIAAIVVGALIIVSASRQAEEEGRTAGQGVLTQSPKPVRVLVTEPLLFADIQSITATVELTDTLTYKGLWLLCENDQDYFVTTLDANNTPKHVYAIPADQVEVVPEQAPLSNLSCTSTQP